MPPTLSLLFMPTLKHIFVDGPQRNSHERMQRARPGDTCPTLLRHPTGTRHCLKIGKIAGLPTLLSLGLAVR